LVAMAYYGQINDEENDESEVVGIAVQVAHL
jgi:hypothetical protein